MNAIQLQLDFDPKTLPPEMAGVLAFIEQHRADAERIAALPIIFHGAGWSDTLPAWMRAELPRARVAHYALTQDENVASDLDVAAYLMSASLEMPLNAEYAHIYLWVCANAIRAYGAAYGIHLPDAADPFRKDLERDLNRDEARFLLELRHTIRAAQFKRVPKTRQRKAAR